MKRAGRRRESAAAWMRRVGHLPAPRLGEDFTGGVAAMFEAVGRVDAGAGFTRKRKARA